MATVRKSEAEEERMTDANIARVIAMLNPTEQDVKPWTKKEACSFLGMSYNTTRLASIIASYEERIKYEKEKRAEKKGKPVTDSEVIFVIQSYIEGETLEAIAKSLYRGTSLVKNILISNSVTFRPTSHDYFSPALIPDNAVRLRFEIGEIVYSAQYNVNAEIRSEELHKSGVYVYKVWLLGDEQQFAYVPAYELASLEHLRKIGVKV
jgi:hypothetical protein